MYNYSIAFIRSNSFNVTVYDKPKCELAATWHSTPNYTEQLTHANSYPGNSSSAPPLCTFLVYILADFVCSKCYQCFRSLSIDLPFPYKRTWSTLWWRKKTIPAGIYPFVECKIGKLYDQRHGVKSHTHVVFDVVDIAFCEPSCLLFFLFLGQMSWQMGLKFRL